MTEDETFWRLKGYYYRRSSYFFNADGKFRWNSRLSDTNIEYYMEITKPMCFKSKNGVYHTREYGFISMTHLAWMFNVDNPHV